MKALSISLALALLVIPARADWVIVEKTTTDGQTVEATMKIKGDKGRLDHGPQGSVILDSASGGGTTVLLHQQKMFMKISPEALQSLMSMAGNLLGGSKGPPEKPKATGEKEKVGAYDTEVYTWTGPLGSGRFWVAKDFPQAAKIAEMQDKMIKAMGSPIAALVPPAADFPGLVVKSETTLMGKKITSENVSVKEEPVDDAVFALPAGYQEMKMPALPGK